MTAIATGDEWNVLARTISYDPTDENARYEHIERIEVLGTMRQRAIKSMGQDAYDEWVAPALRLTLQMAAEMNEPIAVVVRGSLNALAEHPPCQTTAMCMLGCYEAIAVGQMTMASHLGDDDGAPLNDPFEAISFEWKN